MAWLELGAGPIEYARRLAEAFPSSRLALIEDSYTLVPIDQPWRLADELRAFIADRAPVERSARPAA
jgi:pimeloyl-ACP methyl ester carboxylesterase